MLASYPYGDEMMKCLLDFVDISDPSAVNVLYQSFSRVYEKMAKHEYSVNFLNEEVKNEAELQQDSIAKRFFRSFSSAVENAHQQNEHKSRISPEEVQRIKDARTVNQSRTCIETTHSEMRKLPMHLVQCYYTLKHM